MSARAQREGRAGLEAVLLDMDGVVTDTAEAHAAAWKALLDDYLRARGEPFRPFDADRDYREHVDGKPRHDGLRDFLRSRGIELPEGGPDDPPEAETVFGLGKRKQGYFRSWLEGHRVRVYPGTLKLVRELRERGIATAVFSSSRNAEDVLRNAGALTLFDAKVDGNDLAALGLPGKPDPAMLREAAARLDAQPGRAAIVEDAISGVEAGSRGGFGLVIGVDRGGHGEALRRAGAHIVVTDLAELRLTQDMGLAVKTPANLPAVGGSGDALGERWSDRPLAVFLDYDGTLTPIVEDPDQALLDARMREALAKLARRRTTVIVSGRDVGRLRELVGVDALAYVGSHGFEIGQPDGSTESVGGGARFLPALDAAERSLRERLAPVAGHVVERKRYSIAVHYRRVADGEVPKVEGAVDAALSAVADLRKAHGKKVFRILPDADWDKGRAVLCLLERFERDEPRIVPLYVGDDLTDEDAFRALAGRGISVVVRDGEPRSTAADYAVDGVDAVRDLIETLADGGHGGPGADAAREQATRRR